MSANAASTAHVSTSGSDENPGTKAAPWRTIQKAADSATPGTTVYVESGTYYEKVEVRVSGTKAGGFVTFQAEAGVVVSGEGVSGKYIFYLNGNRYVRIMGFDIRDNLGLNTGAGIWIDESGDHLEIVGNRIHNIRGRDAMGIAVYGRSALAPISDLLIQGNEVFDCDPARSEAVTLNGNVTRFVVADNWVHDVNNIGIDFIGGEGTCPDPAQDAARDGVCSGNRVWNVRSDYGGGYAAGIYVDGGRNITVERNSVTQSDLGIEVGAENAGFAASGVIVRNNLIYQNDKVGIIFGGYEARVGRVRDCYFVNNTCVGNDTLRTGNGELAIQYAEANVVQNNIFVCGPQNLLVSVLQGGTINHLDYNLWYCASGDSSAQFVWGGTTLRGLSRFRTVSKNGARSLFGDPRFGSAGLVDFHLTAESPAIDAGDSGIADVSGASDVDGEPRLAGRGIDMGADEVSPLQVESVLGNVVRISWPTSFAGFTLEKTPGFFDGDWISVPSTEASHNGARSVAEDLEAGGVQFYRLRKN